MPGFVEILIIAVMVCVLGAGAFLLFRAGTQK